MVERYGLAIGPADLQDGTRAPSNPESPGNFLFTGEHERLEWNLVPRFHQTEMARLLAPRPFMFERSSDDTEAFQFLETHLRWPGEKNSK